MATVMLMHWPEVTKEQYEQARARSGGKRTRPPARSSTPPGSQTTACTYRSWDSPQDFQKFAATRLNPATQRIGIKGQPKVELSEAHAIFAPNV